MDWIALDKIEQLDEIQRLSHEKPCLIFKHSTRCNISSIAQYRLNDDWDFSADEIVPFYLDLIQFRPISAEIAERFQVHHESPQVLLIQAGECTYDASHLDISVAELHEALGEKV